MKIFLFAYYFQANPFLSSPKINTIFHAIYLCGKLSPVPAFRH